MSFFYTKYKLRTRAPGQYRETSGHEPYVVEGSSAGALQFSHAVVQLKSLNCGEKCKPPALARASLT